MFWSISLHPIFSCGHSHSYDNMMNCLSSTVYYSPQIRAGVLAAMEGLAQLKPEKIQGRNVSLV